MTVKRGRKSIGDLSVVSATAARIDCPEHLTEPQRVEWHLIVNSLPADWFRPADAPLLGAFCVASTMHRDATLLMQSEGLVIDSGQGRPHAHPAHRIVMAQSGIMAQMAVKLRLCPSSRYTEKTAATKANSVLGARPWEDTGTA